MNEGAARDRWTRGRFCRSRARGWDDSRLRAGWRLRPGHTRHPVLIHLDLGWLARRRIEVGPVPARRQLGVAGGMALFFRDGVGRWRQLSLGLSLGGWLRSFGRFRGRGFRRRSCLRLFGSERPGFGLKFSSAETFNLVGRRLGWWVVAHGVKYNPDTEFLDEGHDPRRPGAPISSARLRPSPTSPAHPPALDAPPRPPPAHPDGPKLPTAPGRNPRRV